MVAMQDSAAPCGAFWNLLGSFLLLLQLLPLPLLHWQLPLVLLPLLLYHTGADRT